MKTLMFLICIELPLLWGCADRNHLSAGHGRAYREVISKQAVNPNAGTQVGQNKGLDPEEAALISQSYRSSLVRKGEQSTQENILIVAPKPGRQTDYLPPASVPTEK